VEKAEVEKFHNELLNSNFSNTKGSISEMDYFRVPFALVLDLVRARRVFLKDGKAFVPYTDFIVIIATQFRKGLSHCVAVSPTSPSFH